MRYMVRVEVEAEEDAAVRLRGLLPKLLGDAGYATTRGTTVIASWLVDSTAALSHQPDMPMSRGAANDWMPTGKVKRAMGRGPNA